MSRGALSFDPYLPSTKQSGWPGRGWDCGSSSFIWDERESTPFQFLPQQLCIRQEATHKARVSDTVSGGNQGLHSGLTCLPPCPPLVMWGDLMQGCRARFCKGLLGSSPVAGRSGSQGSQRGDVQVLPWRRRREGSAPQAQSWKDCVRKRDGSLGIRQKQ